MAVRLLIVDDAVDARFLIRVIAEEDGAVEVVGECDGADAALEQIEAAAPDVVVLDAMMPRIDGYELAPLLRARLPHVKTLLLTAHVDDLVEQRAAAAGIDQVLGKDEFDRLPQVVLALAAR
jgi:CheY-like chemotaxis protein